MYNWLFVVSLVCVDCLRVRERERARVGEAPSHTQKAMQHLALAQPIKSKASLSCFGVFHLMHGHQPSQYSNRWRWLYGYLETRDHQRALYWPPWWRLTDVRSLPSLSSCDLYQQLHFKCLHHIVVRSLFLNIHFIWKWKILWKSVTSKRCMWDAANGQSCSQTLTTGMRAHSK